MCLQRSPTHEQRTMHQVLLEREEGRINAFLCFDLLYKKRERKRNLGRCCERGKRGKQEYTREGMVKPTNMSSLAFMRIVSHSCFDILPANQTSLVNDIAILKTNTNFKEIIEDALKVSHCDNCELVETRQPCGRQNRLQASPHPTCFDLARGPSSQSWALVHR